MENQSDIQSSLNKIISANNTRELGRDLISQLKDWKNDIDDREKARKITNEKILFLDDRNK